MATIWEGTVATGAVCQSARIAAIPPGCQANPTTGTGMSGFGLAPLETGNQGFDLTSALGSTASGGPGQWANPTTGTEISSFGLAQPETWRGTTGH